MIDLPLEKFQKAQKILSLKELTSPLILSKFAKTPQGNLIYHKAESLQPSGSFKIRGATYFLSLLTPEEKAKGIVTYSTGNHAQAVALAATKIGVKSYIVMSPNIPEFKVQSTINYGGEVIMTENSSEARRQLAEQLSQSKGYCLLPPYDHADVITGQGTIGLELIDKMDPAAVFVPVGGGGLIAGIAMSIKKTHPHVKIIGVEPEWENDACQSFSSGECKSLPRISDSIADAIKVLKLGSLTFPLICHYVDEMISVSEEQIALATLFLTEKEHLYSEPSGALAFAAALSYKYPLKPKKPVVCILSGGNTTLSTLFQLKKNFEK